ncbi:MAG: YdcF family protein [Halofilum sp. (in: g-proteobacteria)]
MLKQLGYPLPLALALILVGTFLFWRRRNASATALIGIGVLGLYLLATPAVSGWLMQSLERGHEPAALDSYSNADVIVALGGGIMPPAPPQRTSNLQDSVDRVRTAAHLYHAGKAPRIITTGRRPYLDVGPTAAEAAAGLLEEFGVPSDAIIAPGNSSSTREDALSVHAVIERENMDSVLLVTSAFHMRRALGVFEAAGIDATPVPTDYHSVETSDAGSWNWLPSKTAFEISNKVWHEIAGLAYYRLRGWI